jgi:hypothetical protein
MTVGLRAVFGMAQEGEIEDELVGEDDKFDRETKPEPADLVPRSGGRQHRREQAPMQVPPDDSPHDGEDRIARPTARYRQGRSQHVERAENE